MQLLFLAKIFDRQLRLKHRAWQYGSSWLLGSLIAVVWSLGTPGIALNRLTIRIGPIAQTIEVADLEQFARTGEVPPRLRLYSTFLTPQVRQVLQNQLSLDPDISGVCNVGGTLLIISFPTKIARINTVRILIISIILP